jgi:hypothetical protein
VRGKGFEFVVLGVMMAEREGGRKGRGCRCK